MNKHPLLFLLLFLSLLIGQGLQSQEINAVVKDSLTQEVIPYASVYLSSGKGVIGNEEGRFRLQLKNPSDKDSLSISCLGYQTNYYLVSQFKDSIVWLSPKAIALNTVILSNNPRSAEDIIKEIKKDIPLKYELGLTRKKLFFRTSGTQEFNTLKATLKKSSIDEFDQTFWDSTLQKVPRKNDWYIEVLGTLYGGQKKENQKLDIEKALELEDKKTSAIFKNIEKAFDTILKQNVKADSYFKVRLGIISKKLDGVDFNPSEKDTLSPEEKKDKEEQDFLNWQKSSITSILNSIFDEDKLNFNILKKSSQYHFEQVDFTFYGETPVYVLRFSPISRGKFTGKLYVDADQMTMIRMEYKNTQPLRDFDLFGLFFKYHHKEVVIQFTKINSGKYSPQYLEISNGYKMGADRSFTLLEKNKHVRGRKKQNELKMALNLQQDQFEKFQMVIFETLPLTQQAYDAVEEKALVVPVNLTQYDPTFWKGHTIIEPNQAIKNFKVSE